MSEGKRTAGMGLDRGNYMWTRKIAKSIKDVILKYFRRYPDIRVTLTVEDGEVKVWAIVGGVRKCICKVRVLKLKGFYKEEIDLRVENLINTRGNLLGGELEDVIYYRVKGLIAEYEGEKNRKRREEKNRKKGEEQQKRDLYKHHLRTINGLTGQSKKNPKKSKKEIQKEEYELDL